MNMTLENISFTYGNKEVFTNVNAVLAPGRVHYLAGCNGSGKSTLLKLLAGYLVPADGTIKLNGTALAEISGSTRARQLGVMWQNPAPALDFSVQETVEITASARFPRLGFLNAEDQLAIDRALELFELEKLRDQKISTLSGGERQRTVLAGLFALQPEIMLLDEPTCALDPAARNRTAELLEKYAENHTVLVITHDPELLGRAAGTVWLLDGRGAFLSGSAESMLTSEVLSKVYSTAATVESTADGRKHIFFD